MLVILKKINLTMTIGLRLAVVATTRLTIHMVIRSKLGFIVVKLFLCREYWGKLH